jgi:hypothetical protein
VADYAAYSDRELAVKTGDADAFTAIYKRYWEKIYVIAIKRLAGEYLYTW